MFSYIQDSDTSLNKASLNGHKAIVKELLAVGAKVNIQDNVSQIGRFVAGIL